MILFKKYRIHTRDVYISTKKGPDVDPRNDGKINRRTRGRGQGRLVNVA